MRYLRIYVAQVTHPRIVSLVPAATEIVGALGLAEALVGISHECDFPPEINDRPRVTHCPIHNAGLASDEVDRWVTNALRERGTLYELDERLMRELRPELILTQKLCDVCAVGYGSVARLAAALPGSPLVVNLEPARLDDVFRNIETVADAAGAMARGAAVVAELRGRVNRVRERAIHSDARRVYLMEWVSPPYRAGHWNPELVRFAGGRDVVGTERDPATTVEWGEVRAADPEILVLALCGFPVARALDDVSLLAAFPGALELSAARGGRTFVVDGSAYFSRPGPRLVESLEILAGIIHPEVFPEFAPERWRADQVRRVDLARSEAAT